MRKCNAVLALIFALFFISAVHGQTGVNNAALNGNYAFTFTGKSGNGTVSSAFGAVGRFTADGAGNLTNGELDSNTVGGGDWRRPSRCDDSEFFRQLDEARVRHAGQW